MPSPLPEPLPDFIELNHFGGDVEKYLNHLYQIFIDEIVKASFTYNGLRISYRYRPPVSGQHYAFWHFITAGAVEEKRLPDMERCKRVRWVAWMLRHVASYDGIYQWEEQRGSSTDVVLWLEEYDFVVILSRRDDYYLFKTAYTVKPHKRRSLGRKRAEAGQ
jgi:hypothetical protein